mmetsp:Transcript_113885/g.318135  ORF Transcript_113885/g.318135 Transcript_113885/m.318135 type:complete len:367 (+) Transcript_113885:68-1168(+)
MSSRVSVFKRNERRARYDSENAASGGGGFLSLPSADTAPPKAAATLVGPALRRAAAAKSACADSPAPRGPQAPLSPSRAQTPRLAAPTSRATTPHAVAPAQRARSGARHDITWEPVAAEPRRDRPQPLDADEDGTDPGRRPQRLPSLTPSAALSQRHSSRHCTWAGEAPQPPTPKTPDGRPSYRRAAQRRPRSFQIPGRGAEADADADSFLAGDAPRRRSSDDVDEEFGELLAETAVAPPSVAAALGLPGLAADSSRSSKAGLADLPTEDRKSYIAAVLRKQDLDAAVNKAAAEALGSDPESDKPDAMGRDISRIRCKLMAVVRLQQRFLSAEIHAEAWPGPVCQQPLFVQLPGCADLDAAGETPA